MKQSLEEKRRELFEQHKSRLGADAPLMRRQAPPPLPKEEVPVTPADSQAKPGMRSKIVRIIIMLAILLILAELVFFASELGWI